MPETTPRAIRIPDDLWAAALAATGANGDTVSGIVRRALERYVRAHPPQ
jgi:hypothetical protein